MFNFYLPTLYKNLYIKVAFHLPFTFIGIYKFLVIKKTAESLDELAKFLHSV